jgi:hypothetical protein
MRSEKNYLVPDPPSPYDLICFKVYVPKHTLYIGAFWQAYQFFTSWIAWTKDPLHKGKVAAALWRTAYDKARAEYLLNNGVCEMNVTGIRQNPNNKCELQIEFDGNNQWVTVADMSDCMSCGGAGALQFDGVNVNVYNDCTKEFEPSAEPYNPRFSKIYDSVYPVGAQNRCNGAANIAAWLKYVSDQSLSIMSTAGVVGAGASFIIGALASSAGAMLLLEGLIGGLAAELSENADLLDDAAALDIHEEMQDIIYQYMEGDGTLREPNFTELITTLFARRDEETVDTAPRVRWGHETNILSILGPSVISRQNKYAGITDADCSGANWTHVFDFTTGKQGWIPVIDESAEWVSGQGWKSTLVVDEFGDDYRVMQIKTSLPSRTITAFKIYYNATLGTDDLQDSLDRTQTGWYNVSSGSMSLVTEEDTEAGEHVFLWSGAETSVTQLAASSVVGFDGAGTPPVVDPGGTVTVRKIVLSGTGNDPF